MIRALGLLLFPYRDYRSSLGEVPNIRINHATYWYVLVCTLSCSRRLSEQAGRKSKKAHSWYLYERLNLPLGILEAQLQGLDRQKSPKPNYRELLLISRQKQICPAPLMLRPTEVGIRNGN